MLTNYVTMFSRQIPRVLILVVLLAWSAAADAAISRSERQVLVALYISMNGDQWFYNDNWCVGACPKTGTPVFNSPGTECTWTGVTCDGSGTHVVGLNLPGGTGTLTDMSGLTQLTDFSASAQYGPDRIYQLTGPIPDLSRMKALEIFFVPGNQLSGSIPSLAGLANLRLFDVSYNNLSGELPHLAGLNSLSEFNANHNHLSGPLPAFSRFTGPLYFDASYNELTGSIPTLQANLLSDLVLSHNDLTGPLPPLDGLSNLRFLRVGNNHLSGSIASLSGLNLLFFDLSHNELSGPLPSLTGLNTRTFYVQNNHFSGTLPAPPDGLRICEGLFNLYCEAAVCPNSFDLVDSPAWDGWLGVSPWWATPYANNRCDDLFAGDFEDPFK